jgi:hypothetical protein
MPTELVTGAVVGHVDIDAPEGGANRLLQLATVLVRHLGRRPWGAACRLQRERA